MSLPRRPRPYLLASLIALLVAGCGNDDTPPDPAAVRAGQQVFAASGCATCHTLAAADAQGSVGPSLDQRLPSPDEVARRVRDGGSGMPSFSQRLSDPEIDAVAAYVAAVAGRD